MSSFGVPKIRKIYPWSRSAAVRQRAPCIPARKTTKPTTTSDRYLEELVDFRVSREERTLRRALRKNRANGPDIHRWRVGLEGIAS
eukprot:scaffold1638_cov258-Pinguiococcus_pyrenoidosus.AAC.17